MESGTVLTAGPLTAASGVVVAGGWAARHAAAPTVRRWRRSTAPTVMAGLLRHGSSYPERRRWCCSTGSSGVVSTSAPGKTPWPTAGVSSFRTCSGSGTPTGQRTSRVTALDAHLDALDEMAIALQLTGPSTVAGHSMGAVLALHWAARRQAQVERVIAMSAPLYLSPAEGYAHIRGLGRLEATMALDTTVSRATCAWMCRHRTAAGWVAAGLKPHLPVPVARRGTLHTWLAYLASMKHVVLHSGWPTAMSTLAAAIPVLFAAGDRDPVPVTRRAAQLARQYPTVTSVSHPTADHDLPLADPDWCRLLLGEGLTQSQGRPTVPRH